jgi:hypothetical protein
VSTIASSWSHGSDFCLESCSKGSLGAGLASSILKCSQQQKFSEPQVRIGPVASEAQNIFRGDPSWEQQRQFFKVRDFVNSFVIVVSISAIASAIASSTFCTNIAHSSSEKM